MLFVYIPIIIIIVLVLYYIISNNQKYVYKDFFFYDESNKDKKFEKIYFNLKAGNIEYLEKCRRNIKIRIILKHAFFILLISLIILSIVNDKTGIILRPFKVILLQFSIPVYIIAVIKKDKKTKRYEQEYKEIIVSEFVNLYNDKYIYKSNIEENENIVIRNDYSDMKFSRESFDLLNVRNCIYGELEENTKMKFYDISLEKYYDNPTNPTSIFKGIYIVLDIEKNISTYMKILKNEIIHKKDNRVELDSSKFEEYFDVYSEDKIFSMRILTSDIMQILVDFYEKYSINFEIALKDNKIHISLDIGDVFKASIWRSIINKDGVHLYYIIFEFATKLSKKINETINLIEF